MADDHKPSPDTLAWAMGGQVQHYDDGNASEQNGELVKRLKRIATEAAARILELEEAMHYLKEQRNRIGPEAFMDLTCENDTLRAENARLREALEWFADANNYEGNQSGYPSEVVCEGVRKARIALQGEKE